MVFTLEANNEIHRKIADLYNVITVRFDDIYKFLDFDYNVVEDEQYFQCPLSLDISIDTDKHPIDLRKAVGTDIVFETIEGSKGTIEVSTALDEHIVFAMYGQGKLITELPQDHFKLCLEWIKGITK